MTSDSPRVPEAAQPEKVLVGAPDKERPDAREGRRFKVGDRIAYDGDYIGEAPVGTVTRVQKAGYRVAWDDGYKDLPGLAGVYRDDELVAEEAT